MDLSIETSIPVRATSLAIPSPCGQHIVSVNGPYVEVRETSTLELIRSISIPPTNNARFLRLEWSPTHESGSCSRRYLLVTEDIVRVWDLTDRSWSVTINNGSGSMGKIAHAEFGADSNEVLVFSSFGARLSIWSLKTGKKVEIKDPKFNTPVGYGRNRESSTGTFALLTRPGAQDMVSLHAPGDYAVMKSFVLPTVDAQGLKWSRGGKWLAVWDTPSLGYKVLIYTADGNLYRTFHGDYFEDALIGLGLRTIEWSPNGDYCAIGGYENTVTLLRTTTFTPAVYLAHNATLKHNSMSAWQETATTNARTYTTLSLPTTLPKADFTPSASVTTHAAISGICNGASSTTNRGVSLLTFNSTGYLLATKDSSMPTTAWIWDLRSMHPLAVLRQHAIIKKLLWHPTSPNYLAVLCAQDEHIVYLLNAADGAAQSPRIIDMSAAGLNGRFDVRWLHNAHDLKPILMVESEKGFLLVYPDGQDAQVSHEESRTKIYAMNGAHGSGASIDDLKHHTSNGHSGYNSDDTIALPNSKSANPAADFLDESETDNTLSATMALEDTFLYRRGVGVH